MSSEAPTPQPVSLEEVNSSIVPADTKISFRGRLLAKPKKCRNPAVFGKSGFGIHVFGYSDGKIEIVAVKPFNPGFVLSSGDLELGFDKFVRQCEKDDNNLKCALVKGVYHLCAGPYDNSKKAFTSLEQCIPLLPLAPTEAVGTYVEMQGILKHERKSRLAMERKMHTFLRMMTMP